jgi:hypothetical protein
VTGLIRRLDGDLDAAAGRLKDFRGVFCVLEAVALTENGLDGAGIRGNCIRLATGRALDGNIFLMNVKPYLLLVHKRRREDMPQEGHSKV